MDRDGIGRISSNPVDPVPRHRGWPPCHTNDVVLGGENVDERTTDGAGCSDDGNAHSAHLTCDLCQEAPADESVERRLEPPQRPAKERRETVHRNRGVLAIGPPYDGSARPASEQPAEDGSPSVHQRTEAQDDGPDTEQANRASGELREAERHPPDLVPVQLLEAQ